MTMIVEILPFISKWIIFGSLTPGFSQYYHRLNIEWKRGPFPVNLHRRVWCGCRPCFGHLARHQPIRCLIPNEGRQPQHTRVKVVAWETFSFLLYTIVHASENTCRMTNITNLLLGFEERKCLVLNSVEEWVVVSHLYKRNSPGKHRELQRLPLSCFLLLQSDWSEKRARHKVLFLT